MAIMLARLTFLTMLFGTAHPQQFIPPPTNISTIASQNHPGAQISYKETYICETTPGIRAWSGYVHLPSNLTTDASYSQSLFFWYFEARDNSSKAPTTIYLPGGPGTSFLDGASGFPCIVNADSNSTALNPWSFNNATNMLYIDVPVGTGYSYTKPQKGLFDLFSGEIVPVEDEIASSDTLPTNLSSLAATLSSQNSADTANTTQQVQRSIYLLAQIWLQEFPEYRTENKEVNIWGYSYSGLFAPAISAYIQLQNEKIQNGTIPDPRAKPIQLGTTGLNNGCIDSLTQAASYPEFAYNNTYGQFMSTDVYEQAMHNLTMDGGCLDMIKTCRAEAAVGDPDGHGYNDTVNPACLQATEYCFFGIQGAFMELEPPRSPFDLSLLLPAVYPPEYGAAFYNQRWVQEALGVPGNYTLSSSVIPQNFFGRTGDPMRYDAKADLEYLINRGVRLALVYGDRDYRCSWLGGQNVCLALGYPAAPSFRSAGYANITTNASYGGGLVRQHGNLSFSRVFHAGHAVVAYQPETVYRIYQRAVWGKDVATGMVDVGDGYSTTGSMDTSDVKMALPESLRNVCYLYDIEGTCREDEVERLRNGSAVVKDWVMVGADGDGRSGGGRVEVFQMVAAVVALGVGAVSLAL